MKKGKTRFSKRSKSSKSRSRKQKRQRTRRLRYRGGGNTFNRSIPTEAVVTNPMREEDMGLKSQTVTLH